MRVVALLVRVAVLVQVAVVIKAGIFMREVAVLVQVGRQGMR